MQSVIQYVQFCQNRAMTEGVPVFAAVQGITLVGTATGRFPARTINVSNTPKVDIDSMGGGFKPGELCIYEPFIRTGRSTGKTMLGLKMVMEFNRTRGSQKPVKPVVVQFGLSAPTNPE
jgi:hypothetical protein